MIKNNRDRVLQKKKKGFCFYFLLSIMRARIAPTTTITAMIAATEVRKYWSVADVAGPVLGVADPVAGEAVKCVSALEG